MISIRLTTLAAACGFLSSICVAQTGGAVAICPWRFTDGNVTSRTMVADTIGKILERHGYTVVAQDGAEQRFTAMSPAPAMRHGYPIEADLGRYAGVVQASRLIYGSVAWHTRSIWVGTGPKTISTATVDLFVYNTKLGKITYQRRGVEGRSDEKENALKDVLDVLVTPLVTVVSGGPATPREQRAVQIALGRALRPWIQRNEAGR